MTPPHPIPTTQVLGGDRVEGTFPLVDTNGVPIVNGSKTPSIKISVQYLPLAAEPELYTLKATSAVPQVFFPLREVRAEQDGWL